MKWLGIIMLFMPFAVIVVLIVLTEGVKKALAFLGTLIVIFSWIGLTAWLLSL